MTTIFHFKIKNLRTVSESNCSDFRFKKSKRHREQKNKVKIHLLQAKPVITLPCHVVLTRISPRKLDDHDNLRVSFKWIVDAVAEYLIPGKAAGRADDSKKITWDYKQERGIAHEHAVSIEIVKD
jgi:hypothetical protein